MLFRGGVHLKYGMTGYQVPSSFTWVQLRKLFRDTINNNTLFFQSALCRQSAVVTKSQNQGQSGTRQGQIGTRVGQIGTREGQIGTGEGQLEIADRVLEPWFSRKNEISI